MKPKIILLTEMFPFGKTEAFLESEVEILSRDFNITLLPRAREKTKRTIPQGTTVDESLIHRGVFDYIIAFFNQWFLLKNINKLNRITSVSFDKYFKTIKHYIVMCLEADIVSRNLQKRDLSNTVLYSYWLKSSSLGIAWTKYNTVKISRTHANDLYEINHAQLFHPYLAKTLNYIFPVSKFGTSYIVENYNADETKIICKYLGTADPVINCSDKLDKGYHLASCSFLVKRKQIDKVAQALILVANSNPDLNVKWTHIGGGPEFISIKNISTGNPSNLEINLLGNMTNSEIHHFYSNNYINGFINYSTSEGVPVSIMEAISYGIPILASDVGGTIEVVAENGRVISPNLNNEDLAKEIELFINEKYDSLEIRKFWKANFSSEVNYSNFSTFLSTELIKTSNY